MTTIYYSVDGAVDCAECDDFRDESCEEHTRRAHGDEPEMVRVDEYLDD